MPKPAKNPEFDAYIEAAQPFAQPLLKHIRKLVHQACPEVEEVIKWGMPHYCYKGTLCASSAFKAHAALHFWHGKLVLADEPGLVLTDEAMGQFGRITSKADLPDDATFLRLIKKAVAINEQGVKKSRPVKPKGSIELPVPDDLRKALAANPSAQGHFTAFTPGKRKEYIEWLNEAKSEATRVKRLNTALEWIAEGKVRNWKYQNC